MGLPHCPTPLKNGACPVQTSPKQQILQLLHDTCANQLRKGVPSYLELPVCNLNRAVGTLLSNKIVREFGSNAGSEVHIKFNGSAGQVGGRGALSLFKWGGRGEGVVGWTLLVEATHFNSTPS